MRMTLRSASWLIVIARMLISVADARTQSELVLAIRYLQPQGISYSHLYLYREDGKFLRQLTSDSTGQDMDPVFARDGTSIVFTREKAEGAKEFWSIEPLG